MKHLCLFLLLVGVCVEVRALFTFNVMMMQVFSPGISLGCSPTQVTNNMRALQLWFNYTVVGRDSFTYNVSNPLTITQTCNMTELMDRANTAYQAQYGVPVPGATIVLYMMPKAYNCSSGHVGMTGLGEGYGFIDDCSATLMYGGALIRALTNSNSNGRYIAGSAAPSCPCNVYPNDNCTGISDSALYMESAQCLINGDWNDAAGGYNSSMKTLNRTLNAANVYKGAFCNDSEVQYYPASYDVSGTINYTLPLLPNRNGQVAILRFNDIYINQDVFVGCRRQGSSPYESTLYDPVFHDNLPHAEIVSANDTGRTTARKVMQNNETYSFVASPHLHVSITLLDNSNDQCLMSVTTVAIAVTSGVYGKMKADSTTYSNKTEFPLLGVNKTLTYDVSFANADDEPDVGSLANITGNFISYSSDPYPTPKQGLIDTAFLDGGRLSYQFEQFFIDDTAFTYGAGWNNTSTNGTGIYDGSYSYWINGGSISKFAIYDLLRTDLPGSKAWECEISFQWQQAHANVSINVRDFTDITRNFRINQLTDGYSVNGTTARNVSLGTYIAYGATGTPSFDEDAVLEFRLTPLNNYSNVDELQFACTEIRQQPLKETRVEVIFPDSTCTVEEVNTTLQLVNTMFTSSSYGVYYISTTFFLGPSNITMTCDLLSSMKNAMEALAMSGVSISEPPLYLEEDQHLDVVKTNHIMFVSSNITCSWDTVAGVWNPVSYVNNCTDAKAMARVIGENLGLGYSLNETSDPMDVSPLKSYTTLNAPHRHSVGWLFPTIVVSFTDPNDVSALQIYNITDLDSDPTIAHDTRGSEAPWFAITMPVSLIGNNQAHYYVSCRSGQLHVHNSTGGYGSAFKDPEGVVTLLDVLTNYNDYTTIIVTSLNTSAVNSTNATSDTIDVPVYVQLKNSSSEWCTTILALAVPSDIQVGPNSTIITTQAVTTQAASTQAVSTQAVTTRAVSTQAVTTRAVTTRAVTTRAVTTRAVSTQAVTTETFSTQAVSTQAASTQAVTTQAVSTEAVTSQAVSTEVFTTQAISTQAASTEAVTTQAVTTVLSTTNAITTQAVSTEVFTTQAVSTEVFTTRSVTSEAVTTKSITSEAVTTEAVTTQAVTLAAITTRAVTTLAVSTRAVTSEAVTTEATGEATGETTTGETTTGEAQSTGQTDVESSSSKPPKVAPIWEWSIVVVIFAVVAIIVSVTLTCIFIYKPRRPRDDSDTEDQLMTVRLSDTDLDTVVEVMHLQLNIQTRSSEDEAFAGPRLRPRPGSLE